MKKYLSWSAAPGFLLMLASVIVFIIGFGQFKTMYSLAQVVQVICYAVCFVCGIISLSSADKAKEKANYPIRVLIIGFVLFLIALVLYNAHPWQG